MCHTTFMFPPKWSSLGVVHPALVVKGVFSCYYYHGLTALMLIKSRFLGILLQRFIAVTV